ncbi:MAG TPA: hypothetical protein VKI19_09000 [Acidimicrobiales bacterium]|nr:hypothetical protein [Acidimicrobiales bacterium]
MGTGFKVLVLLHVLCVIGGFGSLAYNALYMSLAQRRARGGTSAVLEVNRMVSGLGEALVYGAVLFGIGAVGASHKAIGFGDAWVSAALAVVVVDIGILHGWIRPNQRRYSVLVDKLEAPLAGAETVESRQPDVGVLQSLEKRVGFGWGVFNALVIGAVYLMVFQPGS